MNVLAAPFLCMQGCLSKPQEASLLPSKDTAIKHTAFRLQEQGRWKELSNAELLSVLQLAGITLHRWWFGEKVQVLHFWLCE